MGQEREILPLTPLCGTSLTNMPIALLKSEARFMLDEDKV
jgi:hypothetical protein